MSNTTKNLFIAMEGIYFEYILEKKPESMKSISNNLTLFLIYFFKDRGLCFMDILCKTP